MRTFSAEICVFLCLSAPGGGLAASFVAGAFASWVELSSDMDVRSEKGSIPKDDDASVHVEAVESWGGRTGQEEGWF